jgi:hypothetical protein
MNTITKKELLDYILKKAKEIAQSQHLDIDSDYNLIEYGEGYKDGKFLIQPKIEIDDSFEHIVIVNILYQLHPEHLNVKKLNLVETKYVLRNKEFYKFDKVI